ncbi:MAG: hypothetical protein EON88_05750 [Brevundimonas sp.]|nr:MAG: hypothetical protein EON88_05750 [Brevundimonas sp.]
MKARQAGAWAVFAAVALWAVYQMVRMIDAAATGLWFMSAAGRSDRIVSAMIASAFVLAIGTGLALYAAWRAMWRERWVRLAAALTFAAGLPLLHWQVIAALARVAA